MSSLLFPLPKENPELFSSFFSSLDFSVDLFSASDSTVVVFEVDPNANPDPVPNLTGSAGILGVEVSPVALPKTAPIKKIEKYLHYFFWDHKGKLFILIHLGGHSGIN